MSEEPHRKQNLLDFVDSYKHDPGALLRRLKESASLTSEMLNALESAANDPEWPAQFRTWQAALFGLLGSQVATIANPFLRASASKLLFQAAAEVGFSRSNVLMLTGDISRLLDKITSSEIDVGPYAS
jgi:hypothetical protein